MPALYWMQFYVDPTRSSPRDTVSNTVLGLLASGCTYKGALVFTTQDTALDYMHQRVRREERDLGLEEAESLAAESAARLKRAWPDAELRFTHSFDFDPNVREMIARHGGGHQERVNEVDVGFEPHEDRRIGRSIAITLTTHEEYVLMYGKEETHERNRQRILGIAENIYSRVKPYFGWMDGEADSADMSYDLLLTGRFPLGNELVFIGKELMDRANLNDLIRLGHWHKSLPDGGIVIRWAAKDRWDKA